jgi:aminomethyltransferase
MSTTALYDKHVQAGGRMGEYCGSETALAFGDPRTELAALLSGCGVYDLGWRACFRITGPDRVRWLNGMVSNNVRDLYPGQGNYNFVLNSQGRIQGDLYVYNRGEDLVAATERPQLAILLPLLRKYIIMDRVELTDISSELSAIGLQGPRAPEILANAGFAAPLPAALELTQSIWRGHEVWLTRMAGEHFAIYEIWAAPTLIPELWDALVAAGAAPVGMDAREMFRVAAGIPRYGIDIRDRDLPQETAQSQALNFSKGCYIGQEIVERIRSRGSVHRTFAGFVIDGPPPSPGSKVQVDGKDTGEITSALAVPAANAGGCVTLGLGYLRREAAKPGATVNINGMSAQVSDLPFACVRTTLSNTRVGN